jgi:mevalonate kinase
MTWGFGKAILFGEHAVVYGHAAVAGALDLGVRAQRAQGSPRLSIPAWDVNVRSTDDHPVAQAWTTIADTLGVPPCPIDVDTALPAAAGLGSSAALCVALTRLLTPQPLSDEKLQEVANRGESVFHARPSGIDVALAATGGLGQFRRDLGLESIDVAPFEIAVGLSGEKRSTADMVSRVAAQCREFPKASRILSQLGGIAERSLPVLRAGDLEAVGELFREAHGLLHNLKVSSPGLEKLVEGAMECGAYGAKLTGAGGGGAVIAVARDLDAVVSAWSNAGYQAMRCRIGVLGEG